MDVEMLAFRAECARLTRSFFFDHGYLEVDTPALAPALIPETCLEVFATKYLVPGRDETTGAIPLWLVPSPEVYIKRLIADHGIALFQLSKCYRNVESVGRIHSPEFTMLEYYTMNADYRDSIAVTESFLSDLSVRLFPASSATPPEWLTSTPVMLSMDEAFERFAGFSLSSCPESRDLARHAARLALGDEDAFETWPWDDLYELLLVHSIEPALPKGRRVYLTDYPARVPCLARERSALVRGQRWVTKERWELYVDGLELANCYSEERDAERIAEYFTRERAVKDATARVPHAAVSDFAEVCARMPACSGVAIGFDRLVMSLAGRHSIDSILPFPLGDRL